MVETRPAPAQAAERPAPALVELKQVSRWYGDVVAVNDVTMTIGPGVTGLLGPNGAGKSTLLHIMSGFLAPSAGTATLNGERIWRNHEIYRLIGLVPEREGVYGFLTGWQFVLSSARLHRLPDPEEAARRALATVEMTAAKDRRIETYSKGMRQRVKVAAALVHDPRVLLLDEPLNGLDPDGIRWVRELLRGLAAQGRTVFVSSHLLNEVEHTAERVVVIGHGRLIATGAIADLLGRTAVLRVTAADPVETAELATALAWAGGRVEPDGDGLTARGLAAETAGRIALDRGIALRELATHVRGLEETFHALAHGGAA